MAFEDFETKQSVVVIYTGEGKGKTSASVGLLARSLGTGWRVAYIQFIKHWNVGEHDFIAQIQDVFGPKLLFHKGGKGFYNAGDISSKLISKEENIKSAKDTFRVAYDSAISGDFDLVICDEISNAVHDGLLKKSDMKKLIEKRAKNTSLCLTGRNFPEDLLNLTDIATNMTKIKHHYDDKFLANKGIDY
jgi:cob(I)alamin adenosyltransferase